MSSEIVFRTQLASIMEVLANAAVAEICKLVDDGCALLHLEMSEYQKENESLKIQLRMMEIEATHGCAGRTSTPGNSPNNCFGGVAREKPRGTAKEIPGVVPKTVFGNAGGASLAGVRPGVGVDDPVQSSGLKHFESADADADAEADGTKSLVIKEENPEEGSGAQRELKIHGQGATESCAGEEEVAFFAGVASPERAEELTERHGTRRHVWECVDVEEGRTESLLIKEERLEEDSDPQREINIREERAGKSETARFYTSDTVPERTLFHSHLRSVSPSEEGSGNGLSSTQSLGGGQEAATVDSTPVTVEAVAPSAWKEDPVLKTFSTRNRRCREDLETVEMLQGSAPNALVPQTRTGLRENTAVPDTNQFPPSDKTDVPPLVTHQETGADKRRFICRYCGKGFNGSNELKVHHRVHTGEKPYRCTHCGRGFSQSCSLKKHQTVHTGEKPFGCPQCGKRFSDSGNLRRHFNVHTGYKPFSCAHCGKEYSNIHCFKKHEAVHEAERELGSREGWYTHPAN